MNIRLVGIAALTALACLATPAFAQSNIARGQDREALGQALQGHDIYDQGYFTQRVQPFNPSPFDTYNGSGYRPAPTYQAPDYGGGSRRGYGWRDYGW
jgi:hypothetical protein